MPFQILNPRIKAVPSGKCFVSRTGLARFNRGDLAAVSITNKKVVVLIDQVNRRIAVRGQRDGETTRNMLTSACVALASAFKSLHLARLHASGAVFDVELKPTPLHRGYCDLIVKRWERMMKGKAERVKKTRRSAK